MSVTTVLNSQISIMTVKIVSEDMKLDTYDMFPFRWYEQNKMTAGCSKLKRSVDMTSSGKNGIIMRTNASPKWDNTRCPEE